jgi:hypothetical protein
MTRSDQEFVVVFEQERPLGRVEYRRCFLRFYGKVAIELRGGDLFSF